MNTTSPCIKGRPARRTARCEVWGTILCPLSLDSYTALAELLEHTCYGSCWAYVAHCLNIPRHAHSPESRSSLQLVVQTGPPWWMCWEHCPHQWSHTIIVRAVSNCRSGFHIGGWVWKLFLSSSLTMRWGVCSHHEMRNRESSQQMLSRC